MVFSGNKYKAVFRKATCKMSRKDWAMFFPT